MKLNVADLEGRLARLQEEKDSVLTQHTQYRQHVQLALQSYEAAAMLREDAMGSHVCLRTPYFAQRRGRSGTCERRRRKTHKHECQ